MDTLKQVAEDVASFVGDSGTCAFDNDGKINPEITAAINNARRILYNLGNWKGTKADLIIQGYGGTITMPNAFDFIMKAWFPVRATEIPNEWFTVITNGFDEMCGRMCKPIRMNEPVVTFRDFHMQYPEEKFFRVEVMYEDFLENTINVNPEPVEIKLHGYNKMGGRQTITRKFNEAYEQVTSNPPDDVFMRSLYAATKPQTHGRFRIYEYIPAVQPGVDQRVFCGVFEKDDINPQLIRYRVGGSNCSSKKVTCNSQYLVTTKRKYRVLVNETDPLDIHTDALIHALQALTARKSRDVAGYANHIGLATSFLQRELGQEEPFNQNFMKVSPAIQGVTNL